MVSGVDWVSDEARSRHRAAERLAVGFGYRAEGETVAADVLAHQVEGFLHRDGVYFNEEVVRDLEELELQVARFLHAPFEEVRHHAVGFSRGDVGENRNDARRAEREHRNDHVVVARIHDEVVREVAGNFGGIGNIAARFLDADDVGVLREAGNVRFRN